MSADEQDSEQDGPGIEQVVDPESYNQSRRLKEIHDVRREFHQLKRKASDARVRGDINIRQYNDLVLRAFQSYFYELEGLMHRHSNGDFYLYEVELGKLEPIDRDEPVEFKGLMSLAGSVPAVPVRGYSLDDQRAKTPEKDVLVTAPESVVMRAFRRCNQFVADAGLDAEMQDDEGDAGFDYADILEEGPPGRSAPDIETAETD